MAQPIPHLQKFWARTLAGGAPPDDSWVADTVLLRGLRVGLRETLTYLLENRPSLDTFEDWIVDKNGGQIDSLRIARINLALAGRRPSEPVVCEPVLSREDLDCWEQNGYVIVHDAVPPGQCKAAAEAIHEFLGMDPELPDTWYGGPQGYSIWIPLLHHPAFWANRESPRIHGAFAQLWGRSDLFVTVDQGGMNPPERPGWKFPGPHLHWDVSLALPIPFGVQGILYLTDTAADQGAFTCVPGFHQRIESWLGGLPEGADPRSQDLWALGAVPIPGRAGDLIVWHHALPHGSSPNRAKLPRVVQYIAMHPGQWEHNPAWR